MPGVAVDISVGLLVTIEIEQDNAGCMPGLIEIVLQAAGGYLSFPDRRVERMQMNSSYWQRKVRAIATVHLLTKLNRYCSK
jgi:hypothetical protein